MLPKKIQALITPRIRETLLYTAGCGFALVLKVIISGTINYFGISFRIAYLLTHSLLLFSSFFYHHCITFGRKFDGFRSAVNDFIDFTAAVITLKAVDYLLVNIGIECLNRYVVPQDAAVFVKQLVNAAAIICISGSLFVLRYFIYRVLFKKPPLEYFIGSKIKDVYITSSADREIAANAVSGGVVTALLASMLKNGEISGALVAAGDFSRSGKEKFYTFIAENRGQLIRAQDSIYCDFTYLTPELTEKIRSFPGELAVVGIPCQLKQIDMLCRKYPEIDRKIVLRIGLFCGHTCKPELFERVFARKQIDPADITSFRFRQGRWRGRTKIVFKDGSSAEWPTGSYKLYQNLFVGAPVRCMCCFDHFAEEADISTGDVWCQKHRFSAVKHSITAIRSDAGERVFAAAVSRGDINAEKKNNNALFKANSRSVIFHKAVAARAAVLAKYGIRIPVPENAAPPRWNEKLAARIIAAFYTRDMDDVMKKNRRVLKFWLYVMKGLTSF